MTGDFSGAVDAVQRMDALLEWAGVKQTGDMHESVTPKGAVNACVCAARAIAQCRVWGNDLDPNEVEGVRRKLAKKQEWYALAIWNAINTPGS